MNQSTSHRYPLQRAAIVAALLALALPISGEAGEPLSIVPDEQGHVAVTRQHTARFDGTALELAAQSGKSSAAAPTVRFQLLTVQQGETVFEARDAGHPQVRVSRNRISYARGAGIVERYDMLEAGVEQSFVLRRRWPGSRELTITGSLEADQELGEPLPDGSGGLIVPLADRSWRLRYGAVTAIDAAGARCAGAVAIADGQVTITVDGAWLATATYPVVVDPAISIETNGYYQGRPAAAFDFGGSSSVPGATPARFLVAYEADTLSSPKQIWGKLIQWNGTKIGIPAGDPAYDMAVNISADSSVAHTKPTVAFKFGSITDPRRSYFVAWQRSDGALGFRILDRAGNPTMVPKKIALSGLTLRDPSAATKPATRFSCGGPSLCPYPHLLAYRATATAAGYPSSIRLALVHDVSGSWSDKLVESLGPGDQPLAAPQIAYGHSAINKDGNTDDYYVLVYRRPTGEIVLRKISVLGEVAPPLVVSSSSNGAPVVAYSYASDRWAVFWPTISATSVALRGQLFAGSPGLAPLVPVGSLVTAISVPLTIPFTTLPEYWLAGSQTASEHWPYEGVFELAYVRWNGTGEVYTRKIFAGGTLGSTIRLTSDTKDDRFVQLAVTRIDPLTTSFANPLTCTGALGSRCALWVFEHSYSSSDHDITGYWTSSQY